MKNLIKSKIKKDKMFLLYIITGIVLFVVGIILMPFWVNIGAPFQHLSVGALNYVIASCLFFYSLVYLIPRWKRNAGSFVQTITVIEIVVMIIVGVGCILASSNILMVAPCQILGVSAWVRGVIEVLCGFFHMREGNKSYAPWKLVVAIALITGGTYLVVSSVFGTIQLQWAIGSAMTVGGIVLVIYGIITKSKSKIEEAKE